MLNTGSMKWKISVERRTDTRDDFGQPIPTWDRIGVTRWAKVAPVNGDERYSATQFIARQQTEFTMRWTEDLADVNPLDRIVYPVATNPSDNEIYDIMAVHEIGYREGLRIMAARRAEQ
jgi:SPP1 family predicted phage head-tail adaptor